VENNTNLKSAVDQISNWGFSLAEVSSLGVSAIHKFYIMFGVNIMNFTFKDLRALYTDVVDNPEKYKPFAIWLKKRFDKFIELNIPLDIYVGGSKQFLSRGDELLEKSLNKVSQSLEVYIATGVIRPKMISTTIYYINLIVK
jgi:hypothetical protein